MSERTLVACIAGALAVILIGGAALVVHFRAERSDQRAACVAAGGVPVWQGSRPILCLDSAVVVEVAGNE